ncbi:MAG: zinc-binding dehydrogenase [Salinigranum sp.]
MVANTMEAIVFEEHGGIDVLERATVDVPDVGPGEMLVEVKACALNRLDVFVREGIPGVHLDLPHVSGGDIAGVVAAVGDGVDSVEPGDRVLVDPRITCGECEYCRKGETNRCKDDVHGNLGEEYWGGLAEYVVAPARNAIHMPDDASFEETAALPIAYATAWRMLVTRAELDPGETVLVLGASGGLGTAGVQIADYLGAEVYAATSTEEKAARARERGADHVINYEEEEFDRAVWDLTDKRGVDVVFEHVGEATWEGSIRSLANGGRIVTCGATTGPKATTDIRYLFTREETILGSRGWQRHELETLADLVWRGEITPAIDRVLPLEEAIEGVRAMEDRDLTGKVVVTP